MWSVIWALYPGRCYYLKSHRCCNSVCTQ